MRIALFCGLLAAFLCLTHNANAQYVQRHKANLVDANGNILSDAQVLDLVGEEIFHETYVGAKKQYNAGRKMLIGGAIGAGAGLATTLIGFNLAYDSAYLTDRGIVAYRNETEATIGFICDVCNELANRGVRVIVAGLGLSVLEAGIPLHIIGKKRLDWVAEEGSKASNLTLHAGATPNGFGITLNF